MGIPGCIFLSYGYYGNIVLSLGELSLPYYIAIIPYNFFITFLSIVLCYFYIQSQRREKYTKSLEILNDQLNEINHSV
jgi:hypothetical protein